MQCHVARWERIGPAQRAHGNVLGCPITNAGQRLQRGEGGGHISPAVQLELLARHGPRKGDDCGLPGFDNAELAQRVAAGVCQRGRRGEQPGECGIGRVDRLAKGVNQALSQGARRRDGDLLTQHGPYRQLKAIYRARHAQAIAFGKAWVQHAVDNVGVGIQIEPVAHAANHQRQHLAQRITDCQAHLKLGRINLGDQPANVCFTA